MGPEHSRKSIFRSFVLADFISLANVSFGMAAILMCIDRRASAFTIPDPFFWIVFLFLPAALVCDVADGLIARRLRSQSAFGRDLDSLSDIVSFGVAPAALGFTLGLRSFVDALVLIYFVVCGVSRLARFNITSSLLADSVGKVKFYEGTPIPSSIIIVGVLAIAYVIGSVDEKIIFGSIGRGIYRVHLLAIIYAISGTAMVGTFRIRKP
ncbi:MAG TPA: CDP-alcohol phosphatidyltransferase family protein [Syntrophorhabdaceae bacterium]|nr:CDP-alcohol phosphatidyltransferase family protein [Syntrophorhabdaceae bacterium]